MEALGPGWRLRNGKCAPQGSFMTFFYLSFEKTIGSRTNFTGYRYAVNVASFLPPPLPHPFPEIAIAATFLHLFRNNQRFYKCICRQFFFCHKSILNIWSCILVFFFHLTVYLGDCFMLVQRDGSPSTLITEEYSTM